MINHFQSKPRSQLVQLSLMAAMMAPIFLQAKDLSSDATKGALTGGNITAGTATYSITSYTSTIGFSNDLIITDGAPSDLLFESGWLYRITGDAAENKFPVPDSENFGADNVLLTWNDLDARNLLSAELLIEIEQPEPGAAVITQTMLLSNISAGAVSIDLFNYKDIDVGGTFGNDVAALISSPTYMAIQDGADFAEFRAGNADNYQVTPFGALRSLLVDSNINNLNNSGLPMAADDFTGAFQWTSQSVEVNGEYILQAISSFKTPAPEPIDSIAYVDPIFADGFD